MSFALIAYWTFSSMKETGMREWVAKNPDKVNEPDAAGDVVLCRAASKASSSFVAALVDKYGADVRRRDRRGVTVLHLASSAATVSVLLERGADPTAVDALDETPLMYHTRRKSLDCV